MGCFDDLQWRGLVAQVTDDDLGEVLDREQLTFYVGFDPTAASLHVGNLLQLCNLRRLQQAGHKPIALAGGGTGMIGDPGGKSEERNLLTPAELELNLAGIREQIARFVDFDAGAQMVDNGEWLWKVGYLEFLRDVGKHFTVNQMVARESVKARLERPDVGISYTEFSYMLLQAYDYLQLFDRYGCRLQFGGSDQWGNIVSGVDLIRRIRGEHVYAFTSPLVLNSDGSKMGKTSTGATVWLDRNLTSPYQLWQFLFSTEDTLVGERLRFFTWLSRDEIEALDKATADHPERREAQRALANEVTALVHGSAEAYGAERAAGVLFSEDIASLEEPLLLDVLADAPASTLARTALEGDGYDLIEALVMSELVKSKSEARKALEQGGVYVNNRRVGAEDRLRPEALLHGRFALLRRGKKSQHLLRFEG